MFDDRGAVSLTFQKSFDKLTWSDLQTLKADTIKEEYIFNHNFDVSSIPEGYIYIRAIAKDAKGNESKSGENALITEYKIDRTAPAKTQELLITQGVDYLTLSWKKGLEEDISHYKVYRSDDSGVTYILLVNNIKSLSYRDSNVEISKKYFYKVIAVDQANNESDSSDVIEGTLKQITIEDPSLIKIWPQANSTLPANSKISVLVPKGTAFSSASLLFKKVGSSEWISIASTTTATTTIVFDWDTEKISNGEYEFKALIKESETKTIESPITKYKLDKTPPAKPVITSTAKGWAIDLAWTVENEVNLEGFRIYRKASDESNFKLIQTTETKLFNDSPLSPEKKYSYKVESYDKVGNKSESDIVELAPLNSDPINPVAYAGIDTVGIVGEEILFDGSLSTDNDSIAKYSWDFGDGTHGTDAQVTHSYKSAGQYIIKLEVTDPSGNKSTDEIKVDIYPDSQIGVLEVTIRDKASNKIIPYAYIYVDFPDNDIRQFRADANGVAKVVAIAGNYNICAYQTGYLPIEENVKLEQNTVKPYTLKIPKNDLVVGEVIATPMTMEEIIKAGIDISDPRNHHVFNMEIRLEFNQTPLPVIYDIYYGGFGGGSIGSTFNFGGGGPVGTGLPKGGTGTLHYIPNEKHPEVPPTIAVVTVSTSISWLKEFFDVGIIVKNMAEPQFVIKDASATLNIPQGLSLVPVKDPKTVDFKDIAGQDVRSALWTVRGDEPGSYDISATVNGTLIPFNVPIDAKLKSGTPIEVKGGSGLHLYVMVEDRAYIGEPYYVQFMLVNESSRPFYDLSTSFGSYREPAPKKEIVVIDTKGNKKVYTSEGTSRGVTYSGGSSLVSIIDLEGDPSSANIPVLYSGDSVFLNAFMPGESILGTYVTSVSAGGEEDKDEVYYDLSKIFSTTSGTEIPVTIKEIGSHMTKYKIIQMDLSLFADPIDVNTGAHIIETEALGVSGIKPLTFDMYYNSRSIYDANDAKSNKYVLPAISELGKTTLGTGWSHNYETYIHENADGTVTVYWSPYNFTVFYDGDKDTRVIYGEEDEKGNIVPIEKPKGAKTYYSKSASGEKLELKRTDFGTYEITFVNNNKYLFGTDGKITGMQDMTGKSIKITRESDKFTVEETETGQTLTVKYNGEGLIESVYDKTGRKTEFVYEDKKLVKIIYPNKEVAEYTYDSNGYVLTGSDKKGIHFTNTYDSKGRVVIQGDGKDGISKLSYDETSELWRTITTVTDRNGNTQKHWNNRLGQLVKVVDEIGRTSTYTYDKYGNQTSVTNPNSYTTTYDYDTKGNLIQVTDAEGIETTMTYDGNNNVKSVKNADGQTISNTYTDKNLLENTTNERGTNISYTYNGNGQIATVTKIGLGSVSYSYEKGKPKQITDYEGHTQSMKYNEIGLLTESTDRIGGTTKLEYNEYGNIISKTDAKGNREEYTYDVRGNMLTKKDNKGNLSAYEYDGNNNLISFTDSKGNKTHYKHDSEGRLIKVTDPLGAETITEYDASGQITKITDTAGAVTEYTYDLNGNILTETTTGLGTKTYTYYKNDVLKTSTDAIGNTTTYSYDSAWRLVKVTFPNSSFVTYAYDKSGNMISEADGLGNETKYEYDVYGNMISKTDARGNKTSYSYTPNGNLAEVTDVYENKTKYEYDAEDRLVKVTNSKGGTKTFTYNLSGQIATTTNETGDIIQMEYDPNGNLITIKDSYGIVSSNIIYDKTNLPIETSDALGRKTVSRYNEIGNLVEIVDALNQKTKLDYDKAGRLISVTDPMDGQSKKSYNKNSTLASITDPNGNATNFSYDKAGRLIAETTAVGSSKTYGYNSMNQIAAITNGRGQEIKLTYDKAGQLKSYEDPDSKLTTYSYDANGNVLTVTDETGTIEREFDKLNRVTKYKDSSGNTIEYKYDVLGNLVQITYPDKKTVSYEYNGANLLTKVTDWAGRITKYEYNKNQLLVKTIRPNGTTLTNKYDEAWQLIKQTDVDKDNKIINEYEYEYDAQGKITKEKSTSQTKPSVQKAITMTYDKANRLKTYNGQEVIHDADGNMTYGPLNGQMVSFEYDSRNRLIKAGSTTYEYDAENNRKAVIENGKRTEYVINTNTVLTQVLQQKAEGKITSYIYGNGLIAEENESGSYKTYHFDNRGSTTKLTDITGKITDSFTYGPYGEQASHTGNSKTPFMYNGRDGVMTDSNGLYYMRARYYNPDIKRFINQDVIIGSIEDGRSLNRYAYVNGNPVSLVDPFGLSPSTGMSILDVIHGALDVIGLFDPTPISDLINAELYKLEGDTFNMYLSLAAAAIPSIIGAGSYIAKWGSKAYKTAEAVLAVNKITSGADVIAGAMKYSDEVVGVAKGASKYGDEVAGVAKGSGDIKYRKGHPVTPIEKTYEMAMDSELYAYEVAKKYGINLKGSGKSIKIKIDYDMVPMGKTSELFPDTIFLGRDAFISEKDLANTIAHELSHSRDFLRGANRSNPNLHKPHGNNFSMNLPKKPKSAYGAGNALEDYINGNR